MRNGFGDKDPYLNDYDVSDDFDEEMFADEYQQISSIHTNRFGGNSHIGPQEKTRIYSAKPKNNAENRK